MKKVIVYAWSVFFVARIILYIIRIAGDIYLINQDLYLAIDYILIVLAVAFAVDCQVKLDTFLKNFCLELNTFLLHTFFQQTFFNE